MLNSLRRISRNVFPYLLAFSLSSSNVNEPNRMLSADELNRIETVQEYQSTPVQKLETFSSPDYQVNLYGEGSEYDYRYTPLLGQVIKGLNLKGKYGVGLTSNLSAYGWEANKAADGVYDPSSRTVMGIGYHRDERLRDILTHEFGHNLTIDQDMFTESDFFKKWVETAYSGDTEMSLRNYLDLYHNSLGSRMADDFKDSVGQSDPLLYEKLFSRGYVSYYAMTNYLEDTAETITFLLTRPSYEIASALKHPALADKFKLIEEADFIVDLKPRLEYCQLLEEISHKVWDGREYRNSPFSPIYDVDEGDSFSHLYVPHSIDHENWREELRQVEALVEAFVKKYPHTEEADRLNLFRRYLLKEGDFLVMPKERGFRTDNMDSKAQSCDTKPPFATTAYIFPSSSLPLLQSPSVNEDPFYILHGREYLNRF